MGGRGSGMKKRPSWEKRTHCVQVMLSNEEREALLFVKNRTGKSLSELSRDLIKRALDAYMRELDGKEKTQRKALARRVESNAEKIKRIEEENKRLNERLLGEKK